MTNNTEEAAPDTLYALLGGETQVRALVDAFYDLMDLEPRYAVLRAVHGNTLENDRFGHPRLRARHLPQQIGGHSIGVQERDQWLACMDEAMGQVAVHEALRAHLRQVFFDTADWMRNRPE